MWSEPLHEYAQFSDVIKKLLQYRHQKHVQYEQTQDSLENKREALEELEKNEAEARRLQEALAAAGVPALSRSRSNDSGGRDPSLLSPPSDLSRNRSRSEPLSPTDGSDINTGAASPGFSSPERIGGSDDEDNGDSEAYRRAAHSVPEPLPPAPVSTSRRSKGLGSGLISALSHSIHGMMDVDPEAARRSSISKTKDNISQVSVYHFFVLFINITSIRIGSNRTFLTYHFCQLEDAQHLAAQDLKYASSTIQADLDRFQRQKVADIREMTLAYARIHRDWCKAVRTNLAVRFLFIH